MNAPRESFQVALASAASRHEPRHAALLLHTLAPDDRQWLLERLPASERGRLEALVAELRSIGIPPAPELLDDLAPTRVRPAGGTHAPRGLAQAAPDDVEAVLSDEPVELVARVLSLGAWPWIDEVLARIPAPRRQRVLAARSGTDAASAEPLCAFDRRLLDLVEARLAVVTGDRAARRRAARPAARPAAAGVLRWLEPLLGARGRSPRP